MGIVQTAIQADRSIRSNEELLERELEMLKIIYERHAISEAEYRRSAEILRQNMKKKFTA